MSFALDGSSTARLYRTAGLATTTNAASWIMCARRIGSPLSPSSVLHVSRSSSGATAHTIYVNHASVGSIFAPNLTTNLAAAVSDALSYLYKEAWVWLALGTAGSDADFYVRPIGQDTWDTVTIAQTAFAPELLSIGGSGSGTDNIAMQVAHVREWNAKLNQSEFNIESRNATHQRTDDILSVKSGTGANLAAALTGELGSAFLAGAGVTLDSAVPPFGLTLIGYGILTSSEVTASATTLSTPATPAVTVVNSDTVSINVGSLDTGAEYVNVQGKPASEASYVTLANVAVNALPVVITDLIPGTLYNFRAYVATGDGQNQSDYSPVASASTRSLVIDAYIDDLTEAPGTTGVDVQVWRLPPNGNHLVGEHIDFLTNQSFAVSPVNVSGTDYAHLRVTLGRQPLTLPKLRDGDNVCLVARKTLVGNERWSSILNNAVVREVTP